MLNLFFFLILSYNNNKNLVIGGVYRPPDTDIICFNNSLTISLELINKEKKMCHILGDFNINLFKSETHSPTEDFLNQLYSSYFYPTISKPTRITDKSATLIDNIQFNSLNYETKTGILFTEISDHFPVFQIVVLVQ